MLLALNFKVLFEGLLNQSLQSETVQVNPYDNFNTDKYLFSENDLEFVLISFQPLPSVIGQYKFYQRVGKAKVEEIPP